MMKETKKSLKIYFIAIGVLGILSGLGGLTAEDILAKIISAIILILGILYLYYGIKTYDFLQKSPKILINFVIISVGIKVASSFLTSEWIVAIISLLIGWYLIHNIKKLSRPTLQN